MNLKKRALSILFLPMAALATQAHAFDSMDGDGMFTQFQSQAARAARKINPSSKPVTVELRWYSQEKSGAPIELVGKQSATLRAGESVANVAEDGTTFIRSVSQSDDGGAPIVKVDHLQTGSRSGIIMESIAGEKAIATVATTRTSLDSLRNAKSENGDVSVSLPTTTAEGSFETVQIPLAGSAAITKGYRSREGAMRWMVVGAPQTFDGFQTDSLKAFGDKF